MGIFAVGKSFGGRFRLGGTSDGQANLESRPLSQLRVNGDEATVFSDGSLRHAKTETIAAISLGGEEDVETLLASFIRHTGAIILHLNVDVPAGLTSSQHYCAALRHGVPGVHREIHDHLHQVVQVDRLEGTLVSANLVELPHSGDDLGGIDSRGID